MPAPGRMPAPTAGHPPGAWRPAAGAAPFLAPGGKAACQRLAPGVERLAPAARHHTVPGARRQATRPAPGAGGRAPGARARRDAPCLEEVVQVGRSSCPVLVEKVRSPEEQEEEDQVIDKDAAPLGGDEATVSDVPPTSLASDIMEKQSNLVTEDVQDPSALKTPSGEDVVDEPVVENPVTVHAMCYVRMKSPNLSFV
ncbi:hypothetical protein Bca52824_023018 [Brassica carinata]|uniref:Uncharacterized protein n=1 Tax=Brassica carinata TaxID=52824 RepID=A0A8X7VHR2_BRACI|nr:hypothetical protein Bca52824_023018 [Brassica carinata]